MKAYGTGDRRQRQSWRRIENDRGPARIPMTSACIRRGGSSRGQSMMAARGEKQSVERGEEEVKRLPANAEVDG